MPAKLVVTATPKGSRIALLGSSGKQLLSSAVFTEPRAKGATLRALRGILGEDVTVEDNTTVASLRKGDATETVVADAATPTRRTRRGTTKRVSRRATSSNGASVTRATASPAKRTRRRVPKG